MDCTIIQLALSGILGISDGCYAIAVITSKTSLRAGILNVRCVALCLLCWQQRFDS